MTREEFIEAVRSNAMDAASISVMQMLEKPPGKSPNSNLAVLSGWFHELPEDEREAVAAIVRLAAFSAVFGVLNVIGTAKPTPPGGIPDYSTEGSFELYHVKYGKRQLINRPAEKPLHDLLKAGS